MNLTLIPLLSCALVVTACTVISHSGNQGTPSELTQWVDTELVPYVAKHLSQHPKFKNQSFLVVSIKGDDIQPEIDDLTRYVRDRMMGALLDTPGVNPLWRPATRPWQHPRRLADLACGEFSQARYYIGVDIHSSPLDKTVEVSVRALDVHHKQWVSGFHQSWRGQLSRLQQEALSRRHKDEYLRGLRPLPFSAHQPDLLASYLAHNLSCLLRHSPLPEEVVIYAQPPTSENLPYFRTALDLVDHYLGRFHKVQVVNDPQQATVILESQVYSLHHNLYQVWVTLRHTQDQRYLPGTQTKAYVRLSEPPITPRQTATPQPPSTLPSPPPIQSLPPSEAEARAIEPKPRQAILQRPRALINRLHLRSIPNWVECVTQSRWFGERWAGLLGDVFAKTPCLLVEVAVNHPARLLLVGQNSRGQLRWMIPPPCKGLHPAGVRLRKGEIYRSPLPIEKIQFLELDKMTGESWIYAIAIAEQTIGKRLDDKWIHVRPMVERKFLHGSRQYASLVANQLGLCKNQWLSRTSPSSWLGRLEALTAESGRRVEWKGIKLWHTQHSRR
ncbi:hypothetical protein Nhal_1523 [Nitrosococcus halophilus Nc 4]|uniref:Lipoprotein n=1 Tax=Nitrosococcus halophilus (strain Nc4) TaxID=472759 RepID=D5C1N1_NITHN|nr:hypothetical protein [Nitrosococcus halophilus]ADE14664.1 hypothetical protein Nhal_1523 [Nitrosococcus halophilus Nc 4]